MSGASRGMSIRLRLTCWYASVLLASLALFGAVMWVALQKRLIAGVDTRLAQHTEGLRAMLTAEDEPADASHLPRELAEFASQTPGRTLIQLRDDTGTLYRPSTGQLAFPPQTAGVAALWRKCCNGCRTVIASPRRIPRRAGCRTGSSRNISSARRRAAR